MSALTRAAYAREQATTRPPAVALRYWQARQVPAWGRGMSPAVPSVHEVINAAAGVRLTAGERHAAGLIALLKTSGPTGGLVDCLERMARHVGTGRPSRRTATAWQWLRRVRTDEAARGKDRARSFHTMNFTQETEGQPVNRQLAAYVVGFQEFGTPGQLVGRAW